MNGEAFQSKKPGGVTLTEDISQVIKKIGKRGIYHLTYFNIDIPWDTSKGRRQGIFILESSTYENLKITNIIIFELRHNLTHLELEQVCQAVSQFIFNHFFIRVDFYRSLRAERSNLK